MHASSSVASPEAIISRMAALLGPGRADMDAESGRRLTGQTKPVVQIAPSSEEELATVLAVASAERWSVSPMGNGSQAFGGNISDEIDLIVRTHRLHKVLDYSPADLVVTVQPGMLWADFQSLLADQGQMLPVDPVVAPNATVGGIVSTGASGPLRALYGSLRDMTIGLRVVYPDGRVVKTGGKVVKNVAGYDMTKLFIGSYGTLGVLSEITFKLRPLPPHRELCLLSGDLESIVKLASRLIRSNLVPSRAEVLSGAYHGVGNHTLYTLALECGESRSAAAFQTRRLAEWAAELRLTVAVKRGDEVSQFWQAYQRTLAPFDLAVRFTAPPSDILRVGEEIRQRCAQCGDVAYLSIGCTTGVGRLFVTGASLERQRALVTELRQRVEPSGGAAVLERAPLALRRLEDGFGTPRAAGRLMRGIKSAVDPHGIMNKGLLGGV